MDTNIIAQRLANALAEARPDDNGLSERDQWRDDCRAVLSAMRLLGVSRIWFADECLGEPACSACFRPEATCSARPCATVLADRES